MKLSEFEEIKEVLGSVEPLVIKNIVRRTSLVSFRFGETDVDAIEFHELSNRAFEQLGSEFEGYGYLFYENIYIDGGEKFSLSQNIREYSAALGRGDFSVAFKHLIRLIRYQMMFGFWNKGGASKSFEEQADTLNKLLEEGGSIVKNLLVSKVKIDEAFDEVALSKEVINGLFNDVSSEIRHQASLVKVGATDIDSMLSSSKTYSDRIQALLADSHGLNERLKVMLDAEEARLKETDEKISEMGRSFSEHQRKAVGVVDELSFKLDQATTYQGEIESTIIRINERKKYFDERNSYLDDLIGREVGASLFETFKQRKNEISGSISFWKWSVLVMAVISACWVFFLFGNKDVSAMSWQLFAVNSIKSIPIVCLLLFAISQYGKERNFQEEYAFKSAVALTVNSYASQLGSQENKDKLVMESVNSIYKTPINSGEQKKVDAKELSGTVRELADTVKSIRAS